MYFKAMGSKTEKQYAAKYLGIVQDCTKCGNQFILERIRRAYRQCVECFKQKRNDNKNKWRKRHLPEVLKQCRESLSKLRKHRRALGQCRCCGVQLENGIGNCEKRRKQIEQRRLRHTQRTAENFICAVMKKCRSRKKLEYNLDRAYVIGLLRQQDGRCAITGAKMAHTTNNPRSISIDRTDSSKGYVKGNIQLTCAWINLAKNSMSLEEFTTLLDECLENRAFIKQNRSVTFHRDEDRHPSALF